MNISNNELQDNGLQEMQNSHQHQLKELSVESEKTTKRKQTETMNFTQEHGSVMQELPEQLPKHVHFITYQNYPHYNFQNPQQPQPSTTTQANMVNQEYLKIEKASKLSHLYYTQNVGVLMNPTVPMSL